MPSNPAYDDDDMVTVVDGAALLGVHPNTLRRWAARGRVPEHRSPGNRQLFCVRDLRLVKVPTKAGAR